MTITKQRQTYCIKEVIRVDLESLRAMFLEAQTKAQIYNETMIVSWSQNIAPVDAQSLFALLRQTTSDAFYWEIPSQQIAFVGIGATQTLYGESLANISTAWSAMQMQHVSYNQTPLQAFVRTIFDPVQGQSQLWDDFPADTLIVPSLVYRHSSAGATFTVQAAIAAATDIDALLSSLHQMLNAYSNDAALQAGTILARREEPDAAAWQCQVQAAIDEIHAGLYEKVVLARTIHIETDTMPSSDRILAELRTTQPSAIIFAVQSAEATFLGATPERLASVSNGILATMALAGSLPRGATDAEDTRLSQELLESEKNRNEHAIVVAMISDALAPLTTQMTIPQQPAVLKLPQIQHLHTPIVAELRRDVSILDVAAAMHPTPAVGGFPRAAALAAIRRIEGIDRGLYAAPIGWLDSQGNGDIAVALRSALISGTSLTVFAGCGIVADSVPEQELRESSVKMATMLNAIDASLKGK